MLNTPSDKSLFYLWSDKDNKYLVKLNEENKNLIIILESQKIPSEIFEFTSEHKTMPELFKCYTLKDIIKKLSKEKNKIKIKEKSNCLELIYEGIVESEKANFQLNRKEKSLENKISELYDIIKYKKEIIDNLNGFQSKILTERDKNKILSWLNELNGDKKIIIYLKLVYTRGNNYSFDYFHQKCDGVGPNLVICESVDGEIFGGYTPFSWEYNSECKYDESSFIFSTTKNKKYPNKKKDNKSNFICKSAGPDFHWDFVFNNRNMYYCRSFIPKDFNIHHVDTGNNCYLNDEPLFGDGHECEIKEVEVFQVMKYITVPINK